MIVNENLKRSYPCKPTFNVPPRALEYVSPIAVKLLPFPGNLDWLAPGQGVLIKLQKSP